MKPFDVATQRLDRLQQAHLSNVSQLPRVSLAQVVHSFNSYMSYARMLSGLEPKPPLELPTLQRDFHSVCHSSEGVTELPAGSETADSSPVPIVPRASSCGRYTAQLHKIIFNDPKKLRRKEDFVRFREFLENDPSTLDYTKPYWKIVLNEPIELADILSIDHVHLTILRVCVLFRYKLELNTTDPHSMLEQFRRLQAQSHPRRREENNKFLFKRFFKWVQRRGPGTPTQNFDDYCRTALAPEFDEAAVQEFFHVVRDNPLPFGGAKHSLDKTYRVPCKINSEFEERLFRSPAFRADLLEYMENHLPDQAREELKENGVRFMFRFYPILKEININALSAVVFNHIMTKKYKTPWTVTEVNEIIKDTTARIRKAEREQRETLDKKPEGQSTLEEIPPETSGETCYNN